MLLAGVVIGGSSQWEGLMGVWGRLCSQSQGFFPMGLIDKIEGTYELGCGNPFFKKLTSK